MPVITPGDELPSERRTGPSRVSSVAGTFCVSTSTHMDLAASLVHGCVEVMPPYPPLGNLPRFQSEEAIHDFFTSPQPEQPGKGLAKAKPQGKLQWFLNHPNWDLQERSTRDTLAVDCFYYDNSGYSVPLLGGLNVEESQTLLAALTLHLQLHSLDSRLGEAHQEKLVDAPGRWTSLTSPLSGNAPLWTTLLSIPLRTRRHCILSCASPAPGDPHHLCALLLPLQAQHSCDQILIP
eukprot:scaffold49502_cov39-Prasinocladus_malaysianus.AAC.2